jgi:hypothetical protein
MVREISKLQLLSTHDKKTPDQPMAPHLTLMLEDALRLVEDMGPDKSLEDYREVIS